MAYNCFMGYDDPIDFEKRLEVPSQPRGASTMV